MSFTRTAGYRSATLVKPRGTTPPGETGQGGAADAGLAGGDNPSEGRDETASDERVFRALVATGDRHRDAREWLDAEIAYGAALSHRPEEAGYWVQHGHMRKEQGRFGEAEVSYRTGAALGACADVVIEHVRFVMDRQGVSEARYPVRYATAGGIAERPPGEPDVLLLARLLWRVGSMSNDDMLALIRGHATCDDLFAAMVADQRFAQANIGWLSAMRDEDL